jgi:predicted SnoaL-like aldol condensation-catalyzing enzyme
MPSRARVDEFIAAVESGDHAGAVERYYTEDATMQENAAPPRQGRDKFVAHEREVMARMARIYSKAVSSVVEGDRVAIHWNFEMTDKSGQGPPLRRDRLPGMARRPDFPRALLL